MEPQTPTSITVTLRVVGIQYQVDIEVMAANPTIRDLMEAARAKKDGRNFQYMTAPDGSLHSASAYLPTAKISISSGRLYDAGLYALADDVDAAGKTSVKTWQWYVIRNGQQVNQPDKHVEKFSLPNDQMGPPPQYRFLQDGDLVIWRLVVVAVMASVKAGQSSYDSKVGRLTNSRADLSNAPQRTAEQGT